MEYITKNSLIDAILSTGISKGDTVMIHSDISSFGTTENFSRKDALNIFYEAFMEVLGESGTLCTPAYFYEYARHGIPFDITLSPVSKELGVFAKFINTLPNRKRSPNPLTSICAVGKNADYICEFINRHAYGKNSAFDRLYKLNAKIIALGARGSFTINHLAEYKVGVPYLYNKIYNLPVYNNGKLIFENSIGYVRYLDYDIEYVGQTDNLWYERVIFKQNFTRQTDYLNAKIYCAESQGLINFLSEQLYHNPYYLLTHTPHFPEGKVPNDGPVLKK